jgi:polysaccharide export outer membrane protein
MSIVIAEASRRTTEYIIAALFMASAFMASALAAQQIPGLPQASEQQPVQNQPQLRPDYILGPNDQIIVRAPEVEELNERPFRVDSGGQINAPLVGRVRAAGMAVKELEAVLVERLKQFVRQPRVTVTVTQFRAEPVFFVGAFRAPGIYPLQGRQTLVDMLANVGGLQPNASRRIKVTRRSESGPIPLPNVVTDPVNKVSIVEISMSSLRENVNPAEDILLKPFDVISVDRAELLYINGEVGRVGGIELGERDSISLSQALTMAGGFTQNSDRSKVRILRPVTNTARRAEIEIDATQIFEGKGNDFPLMPNDVLFVPRSRKRAFWTTFGMITMGTAPYLLYTVLR